MILQVTQFLMILFESHVNIVWKILIEISRVISE